MDDTVVVLTRPAGENEAIADLLRSDGYPVVIRPMIELLPCAVDGKLKQTAMNLDHWDKIIFVSKTAARLGMAILDQYWPAWPDRLQWYAVGEGTAEEMSKFDVDVSYPAAAGSEGLLALPGLQDLDLSNVLVVRGVGGRELLSQTMSSRGASVSYWELYERKQIDHPDLPTILLTGTNVIVVLTSMEILENFMQQITAVRDENGPLCNRCTAIVPSERIAVAARKLPFLTVKNAGGASDKALYDAIRP